MYERESLEQVEFYTAESRPYGLTYGQWTVEWWRWFLSIPKLVNPAFDKSGEYANVNQKRGEVWFLAGKVGDENADLPERSCEVPRSHSILFPVINCEVNSLELPELTSHRDLVDHVSKDENSIILKECVLDNITVPVQRVKSDPSVFEVKIDPDNPYNVYGGGVTIAAADGYWVFLKPLPVGNHDISFRGSCENGRLNSGATYHLQVE